jgi:hypothetical protein
MGLRSVFLIILFILSIHVDEPVTNAAAQRSTISTPFMPTW